MAQATFNHKAANLWVSRIIPVILIGIVGYVTWVVVVRLCVNYLLNPPATLHTPRNGAATAILTLYALLLLFMGFAYFRLLYTVTVNPGYVPRGPQWYAKQENGTDSNKRRRKGYEKEGAADATQKARKPSVGDGAVGRFPGGAYTDGAFHAPMSTEPAPGLQSFYERDVFVCQGDGRPIWCSTCENWKPDRAHHCREIERCVRKMDHFCPWVGGVVSETSFKFFIQFVGWTALYCIFNLIVMAYFVAEHDKQTHKIDVHWLITLCLGGLFALFTVGMTGSSLQFATLNSSTIENLSRKNIVWTLAIYMPRPPESRPGFRTISFSSAQSLSQSPQDQSNEIRTFAILHTKPSDNPFDLGPYENFKSVMGDHFFDWILPFRYSPCCNHDRQDGQFAMGPVVQRMREEAGIVAPTDLNAEKGYRRRRRKRKRHRGDVERADEPITEKLQVPHENHSPYSGHDRDEIDLESGLGHANSTVH